MTRRYATNNILSHTTYLQNLPAPVAPGVAIYPFGYDAENTAFLTMFDTRS